MTRLIKKISKESERENISRRIFLFLLGMVFLTSACYFFFAGSMIYKMVGQEKKEENLKSLSYEHQRLEDQYFKMISEMDIDRALSLGFVEYKDSKFAVRQTTVAQR